MSLAVSPRVTKTNLFLGESRSNGPKTRGIQSTSTLLAVELRAFYFASDDLNDRTVHPGCKLASTSVIVSLGKFQFNADTLKTFQHNVLASDY